jgi:hypothetical protein
MGWRWFASPERASDSFFGNWRAEFLGKINANRRQSVKTPRLHRQT